MTPDERPFDERFAERVRDVFDAYEEPADVSGLDRVRAALGAPAAVPPRAPDRPPVAGRAAGRARWALPPVLAALVVAAGAGLWLVQTETPTETEIAAASAVESGAEPGVEAGSEEEGVAERPAGVVPDAADRPTPAIAEAAPPPAGGFAAAVAPSPAASASRESVRRESVRREAPARTPEPAVAAEPPTPTPLPEAPVVAEPAVSVAALPPAPAVLDRAGRDVAAPAPPARRPPADAAESGVRLVVASTAAFSGSRPTEGAGVAAGVVRAWRVAPRVSVSGGAIAAYGRYAVEAESFDLDVRSLSQADLIRSEDVTAQSTFTTLAVEIPVDIGLDVAPAPGGRFGVSVGLTSAVYLAQTFEDEGQTYAGEFVSDPGTAGEEFVELPPEPFVTRETVGPLGRIDLARQLNLGVGYTPAGDAFPLAVDVYGRLPLGGVTSRDLALTVLGVRLRFALP